MIENVLFVYQAEKIGRAGQKFMWKNLTMDYVYDYMFHLLNEYSKLQDFKPVVPANAQLLCPESVLCFAENAKTKDFLQRAMTKASNTPPCILPTYDPQYIEEIENQREQSIKKVWGWEGKAPV